MGQRPRVHRHESARILGDVRLPYARRPLAGGAVFVNGEPGGPTPIRSPHLERFVAAHGYQGDTNDCGPFSATIALAGLGQPGLDAPALARRMDRPRWRGGRPEIYRVPGHATFPWGLAAILRRHGLAARWRGGATAADLRAALARGAAVLPFVGTWRPPSGHVMVLAAYDPERGWGFVDPGRPSSSLAWFSDPDFQRMWRALGRLVVVAEAPPEEPGNLSGPRPGP